MVIVRGRVRYGFTINVAGVKIENNGGLANWKLARSGLGCQDFAELAQLPSFRQISSFVLSALLFTVLVTMIEERRRAFLQCHVSA